MTRSGKKGKKKQNVKISEATRIQISQILEDFRSSNAQEYKIELNLTNVERAAVHMMCRKLGMKSKSSGLGDQRRLCVFKTKRTGDTMKGKDKHPSFTFSEESNEVLRELFTRYPPDDGELGEEMVRKQSGKTDKMHGRTDDFFRKPLLNKAEIAKKVESISARMKNPNLRQIIEERSKLPIASFRDVITSTIESHQVVLISGETGCGKTTQVPQYLLDYMWGKGETCKIVCTQPRRISATSVSERISSERGESVGDSVGYKIRLESKGGRNCSIVFCTNGILLRVLVARGNHKAGKKTSKKGANDEVSDVTHIIVDEIHERDRYSDFMLAIIRDMLPSYPHLRLVLMSATLDAERFSQYFGGCPIIRVPGFTHPVKNLYLEDVLSMLNSTGNDNTDSTLTSAMIMESDLTEEDRVTFDEAINLAWSNDEFDPLLDLVSSEGGSGVFNFQHSSTGVTPLMVFARKGRVGDLSMLLSLGADCHLRAKDGTTALDWAQRENQGEAVEILKKHLEKSITMSEEEQRLLDKYLSTTNPELIDGVLIEKLLKKICTDMEEGAILVFLPGWDDINRTGERLRASPFFNDSSKFVIITLHSMVPPAEQKKVFKRVPPGCRKIILSTNIAETAVTIDDVVYVIDSGRMKEKSYDPYSNVSTLHSSWVSKASAKQREGRAGRCQPGICYHLYSKLRAASLPDFQVPEIRRIPIEELCLQVKLIDPYTRIDVFLNKTLDPPVIETIRNAIIVLQDIGALSKNEELTDLGKKIGSLPVHPLISKMLFFGILLNCLDPALTLACASDYRDVFTLPMLPHEKKKAADAKAALASLYGGHSDQLAVIAAFECWKKAKEKGQEARFCSMYFVSSGTMNMLSRMRKQLKSELLKNGFIPEDSSRCSLNSQNPGILHAVIVAGLYPMVGRVLNQDGKPMLVETAGGDKVRLHPASMNFKLTFKKSDNRALVIFDEITRGDRGLHIRNCGIIGALPLLMLATEIVVAPGNESDFEDESGSGESDSEDDGDEDKTDKLSVRGEKIMSSPDNTVKVIVDRWLYFESTAIDVAQVYCLRERLSTAILFKVTHPRESLPEFLGASVYAIACILSSDGLSGISVASPSPAVSATQPGESEQGKIGPDKNSIKYLKSLICPKNTPQNTVQHHKGSPPLSRGIQMSNTRMIHHLQPLPDVVSMNSPVYGYGPGMYGMIAPVKGDSFKRQRGYRS